MFAGFKACYSSGVREMVTDRPFLTVQTYMVRLKNRSYSCDILPLVLHILPFVLQFYRNSTALNIKDDFLKCTNTKIILKPFYIQILSYDTYYNTAERNLSYLFKAVLFLYKKA